MKKRTLLIVGLALLVATAGVVYAHWTATLTVEADVSTGTITMSFVNVGTDDDGNPVNDLSGLDVGDVLSTYDAWGAASTADPAGMYRYNSAIPWEGYVYPYGFPRYDKDVGKCTATYDAVTKTMTVTVEEAYPSYFCTLFFDVKNEGTVPVKLQGGTFGVVKGAVPGVLGPVAVPPSWQAAGNMLPGAFWSGIPELTFDFAKGMWCGTQLDPQESQSLVFWLHVQQGEENSTMSQTYEFDWTMEFVNWNEWDVGDCPAGSLPTP